MHSPFRFLVSALSCLLTLAKESTPCLWKLMNHSYARKGLSANMVTFQAPIGVKPQQSLCVSFQQSPCLCVNLPGSRGPLSTHLPDSMMQRPERKPLTGLETKAKIPFSGFLAAKWITIRCSLFMLGWTWGTQDGYPYPVEHPPPRWDGGSRLVGQWRPLPQMPAPPLPGKVRLSSAAAALPVFALPL